MVAWLCGFILFYFAYMLIGKEDGIGFLISLLATLVIGSFTSVGSCTIMGFIKAFPADSVSGYSSGTGLAGISGAGMYLFFSTIGLSFNYVVLLLMPIALIYTANFRFILDLKTQVERSVSYRIHGTQYSPDRQIEAAPEKEAEEKEAKLNEPLSIETVKNVINLVGWPLLNLSMVKLYN